MHALLMVMIMILSYDATIMRERENEKRVRTEVPGRGVRIWRSKTLAATLLLLNINRAID